MGALAQQVEFLMETIKQLKKTKTQETSWNTITFQELQEQETSPVQTTGRNRSRGALNSQEQELPETNPAVRQDSDSQGFQNKKQIPFIKILIPRVFQNKK